MQVTVFGAGYVGLVTGSVLADLGHHVTLVEVSSEKILLIEQGIAPFYEPGLSSLLERVVQAGRLEVTNAPRDAVRHADIIFIAVGTPSLPNGEANLSYVREAAMEIGRGLSGQKRQLVVNKATVPIGCANLVQVWIQDGRAELYGSSLSDEMIYVASNPEFLREGSAISDTLYPDRIVLGADDGWAFDCLVELYQPIIEQDFTPPPEADRPRGLKSVPVVQTERTTAEMIKYAANAFLATKISFANEVSNISERVGADTLEVMRGIGMDERIGPRFLRTGIGWGGSCFQKDILELSVTAEQYGYYPRLLHATVDVNRGQRQLVIKRLQEELKAVKGRRIAVWGLSFKPGTDDLRDAPAVDIIEDLIRLGARVSVYDPVAMPALQRTRPDLEVIYGKSPEATLQHGDALVLTTEWPVFNAVPLAVIQEQLANPLVIDGRNMWDPVSCQAAGLRYRAVGR